MDGSHLQLWTTNFLVSLHLHFGWVIHTQKPQPFSVSRESYGQIYVSLISAKSTDLIWVWLFHRRSCLTCVLAVFILEATNISRQRFPLQDLRKKSLVFPSAFLYIHLLLLLHPQFDFYCGSVFRAIVGHTLRVAVRISSTKVATAGQAEKHDTVNIDLWIMKE